MSLDDPRIILFMFDANHAGSTQKTAVKDAGVGVLAEIRGIHGFQDCGEVVAYFEAEIGPVEFAQEVEQGRVQGGGRRRFRRRFSESDEAFIAFHVPYALEFLKVLCALDFKESIDRGVPGVWSIETIETETLVQCLESGG